MKLHKNIFIIILLFLTISSLIVLGTYYYISNKQKNLLNSIYNSAHLNIVKMSENLIKDKQNTTLAIALSLAKNENLYEFMQNQEFEKLDYKKIASELNQYSKYKNVWIQIVDKNGNSVYRSWTDKKGDNLSFRKDLKNSLINHEVSTSISVGLFSLSIKARTPIFDKENNFVGNLEVITHFNSIVNDLKANNIYSLIITDKAYKNIIKYPDSDIFIEDYYIANNNANKELVDYIKSNNVEKYTNIKDFIVENDHLISNFILYNKNGEKLAYILNFMDLKNIDTQVIESFKVQIIMISIIVLITIFFSFLIYFYNSYVKEIKFQENQKQSILDSQSNIIVITDGNKLIDANKKLFEFFTDVKNLKEFKKKYKCICSSFLDMKNEFYIVEKDYEGKNWAEYILENSDKNFRVAIKDKEEIKHFSIKASKIPNRYFIIITLTDISEEIKQIKKDKEKDRLLYQQSKIAAIADTLKNIAHQWRQPLSVISTIASGLKLQKELDILSDDNFNSSCELIIDNTQKLSNTIENFTNFFSKDDSVGNFSFIESIKNTIDFFNSIFEKNSIKCQFIYDKDFILKCNKSDFSQAILNILDNSIYALIQNKKEDERVIFIELKDKILQIKDSANGIDENILSKIVEPYFTTKHQAFGVGLGLYVVQEFFTKNLGCEIDIKNVTFDYENKKYSGTNFIINFN